MKIHVNKTVLLVMNFIRKCKSDVSMSPPVLSKNSPLYQLVCHTTDTFTSCIKTYEELLPYLQAEGPDDSVNRRLFNIGGMLTILNSELTTLKNEITTPIFAVYGDDPKVSKSCVESKGLIHVVEAKQTTNFEYLCGNCNETLTVYNQDLDLSVALHILDGCCRGNPSKIVAVQKDRQVKNYKMVGTQEEVQKQTEDQGATYRLTHNLSPAEQDIVYEVGGTHFKCIISAGKGFMCTVCNKYLKGLEYVEEHVRNNSHQKVLKQRHSIPKQTTNFEDLCGNCNKTLTVYNQNLNLSVALHILDGCCRGNPNKMVAVQKDRQVKNSKMVGTQEEVQKQTEDQGATYRFMDNLYPAEQDIVYEVGGTHFKCIKSAGKGFMCTVCNKYLKGPEYVDEHVRDKSHQKVLKKSVKEIQKNTDHSVVQEEIILSQKIQFSDIVESLTGSLYSQRQYFSLEKGILVCNLCDREIPPTSKSVKCHVNGKRHITKLK